MTNQLVTIVVPIYKTEKYLEQCIVSIVNQTYQNLEIILVDDGSPDACPQLCDDWAEKDQRIRVIHKENGGLSSARNAGMDAANGAYICFFDSDDLIAPNTIELSYNAAQQETADIVLFGYYTMDSEGITLREYSPKPEKPIYQGEEIQEILLPDLLGPNPRTGKLLVASISACMCLFSTKLLERANSRFQSEREIISEDVFFLLGLYRYVNKAVVLPASFYFYRDNQSSVSRSYRPDRYQKISIFYRRCLELCVECGYTENVIRRCAEPFISFTIAAVKQEVMHNKTMNASLCRMQTIINDDILQQVLEDRKNDKAAFMRTVLFWAMRHKMYRLCYFLVAMKNKF